MVYSLGCFQKGIYQQSIRSFQLLPCACEPKWDVYFQYVIWHDCTVFQKLSEILVYTKFEFLQGKAKWSSVMHPMKK